MPRSLAETYLTKAEVSTSKPNTSGSVADFLRNLLQHENRLNRSRNAQVSYRHIKVSLRLIAIGKLV